MSRSLTILILLTTVIIGFFLIYNLKDSYKILPFKETPEEETSVKDLMNGNPEMTSNRNWRLFVSPQKNFKAYLPALPQHTSDTILDSETKEARKYESFYVADDFGPAYMINTITFPRSVENESIDETLKSVVNDILARNKNNKLNNMKIGHTGKFKSLDYQLENNDVVISGKVIAHGDTLYVLSMMTKNDSFDQKNLDEFVNAFKILD